jgi:hypothetical protein
LELGILILLGLTTWFWLDGVRVRELAIAEARHACRIDGVQFLDDTVALSAVGFARDGRGQLRIRRSFAFEFSETGDNRRHGSVVMLGNRLETLYLEPHGMDGS